MTAETDLMDRNEAADFLRVSPRTLDRIAALPRVRIGDRRIFYRREDLRRYVAGQVETRAAT